MKHTTDIKPSTDKNDPYYVHLTYPYNRPGPGNEDDKNQNLSKARTFNFAFPSIPDINDINWKEMKYCTTSTEGNNGVIFCHTSNGNFVIKGSTDPALELFGNYLYSELQLDCPSIRVLPHSSNEFKKAVMYVDKGSYFDHSVKFQIRNRMDRPFLLLMEYIPGLRINELGPQKSKESFEASYPDGRDKLIRLGLLLAADTFVNNSERYPLIWNNNGNSENLIIKAETDWNSKNEELFDRENFKYKLGKAYAVGNKPQLYGKETQIGEDNYNRYIETFEDLVKLIFELLKLVKNGKINPFDSKTRRLQYASIVSTFIYNFTQVDIKPLGELQILLGLCLGFANILNLGMDVIENTKNKVSKSIEQDWKGYWKENCDAIRLPILRDEMNILKKYITGNEEIVGWANTITLNNYLLRFEKNVGSGDNDGDSSILSYQDEQHERSFKQQPQNFQDEWLDRKIHEHFGVAFLDEPNGNYRGQSVLDQDISKNSGQYQSKGKKGNDADNLSQQKIKDTPQQHYNNSQSSNPRLSIGSGDALEEGQKSLNVSDVQQQNVSSNNNSKFQLGIKNVDESQDSRYLQQQQQQKQQASNRQQNKKKSKSPPKRKK